MAVAGASGRATVDRAAPAALVLGHMGRQAQRAQDPDEVARVVGPVGTDRGWPGDPASSAGQAAAFVHLHGLVVDVELTEADGYVRHGATNLYAALMWPPAI